MKPHPLIRKILTLGGLILLGGAAGGQTSPVLEQYIQDAFANSHALKEQQFQLDRSLLALEEAKRLYFPEVTLGGSYSLAAGGRTISFPVGDLLNPVYSTLNELTQSNAFPQLENVNEQLLPNNFYDLRIRARQPLINAEIRHNRDIRAGQATLREIELRLYRRELVRDVKKAYFQYLQTVEAVRILEEATRLLQENRRVNESLLRNDKVIPSVLTRTESELAAVEANLAEARGLQRNAAAYLNQLLGRDLAEPIVVDTALVLPPTTAEAAGPVRREELEQLAQARVINESVVKLEESYRIPQVGLQLDAGSQNFDFRWGDYLVLGLSVELPLWTAGRNKLQVQQAVVQGRALEEQTRQAEDLIRLEINNAYNNLAAQRQVWQSFETQLDGTRRFYDDTFRRYKEGVASYIELLDARTELTTLDIRRSIAFYNVLIREAELERALGAFAL